LSSAEYTADLHGSLTELAATWDSLHDSSNPFISSQFLLALEKHGAVANNLGWQPFHLALQQSNKLLAAAPGYLTSHSFGDFVYDWGWAQQAQQAGYNWYPKWVIEVPYSPVTGARLLTRASGLDHPAAAAMLVQAILQAANARAIDCVQINYCDAADATLLAELGFLIQRDTQFHWHRQGETDFDGFLQHLRTKRRKEIRRERNKVAKQGIRHRWVSGAEARDDDLRFAHSCYEKTFHEKGNFPALTLDCLHSIADGLGERFLLCLAETSEMPVACAICLRSDTHLYGRYWGCRKELDCLHFETCYYQGIEYCLDNGLDVFEPGAGGGHKLQRGYRPVTTYSAHLLPDPRFRDAVARFLEQERYHEAQLRAAYAEAGPFKKA